jgi:hypothetical protein
LTSSSAHRRMSDGDADLGDGPVDGWLPDRFGLRCPACTWLLETWIGSAARAPLACTDPPAAGQRTERVIVVDGRFSRCPNGHDLPQTTGFSG